MDRAATAEKIAGIVEPFNKKGVAITDATTFAGDLEFDSLTVMDFVAAIEEGRHDTDALRVDRAATIRMDDSDDSTHRAPTLYGLGTCDLIQYCGQPGGQLRPGQNRLWRRRGKLSALSPKKLDQRLAKGVRALTGDHRAGRFDAEHRPDFITVNDPWFRAISLAYGPDGDVVMTDWSDFGECHDRDGVHRSSGRIYKIPWGAPRTVTVRPAR